MTVGDLDLRNRVERLQRLADQCRLAVLDLIYRAGSGHAGSSLSCVDLLTVLRFEQLNWPVDRSRDLIRDAFVLSKGHAAPAWYAALLVGGDLPAHEIRTLRRIDSRLQGHPDRTRLDLVDASTGALGQGLSMAIGMVEARRLRSQRDSRVFCLVGDGELQAGQVWEALMYAGARRLANLVLLVDHNKSQSGGDVARIMPLDPLAEKLRAFGWHVQDLDGHSPPAILEAFAATQTRTAGPSVVLAHTRKGYLGPGRVLLDGAHAGVLDEAEYLAAVEYLGVTS